MKAAAIVPVAVAVLSLQPDAAQVLTGMRQALGGDAAIAAIQSFSFKGSESRNIEGHTFGGEIEWLCELPERWVRIRRIGTPLGQNVDTDGFNGAAAIRRRDSSITVPPDPFEGDTPDQKAARQQRAVRNLTHEFSRLAVSLIGVPAVDPLDASYEGRRDVDGKPADVVQLRSRDGYVARLFVDPTTHLPVAISWMAPPIVTFSTSTVIAVPRGQSPGDVPIPPPVLPRGDPTAGRALVEHQIHFDDFKAAEGMTWPHRFTEKVDGKLWQTIRVGKYKLNPRIDPKQFDPSRR